MLRSWSSFRRVCKRLVRCERHAANPPQTPQRPSRFLPDGGGPYFFVAFFLAVFFTGRPPARFFAAGFVFGAAARRFGRAGFFGTSAGGSFSRSGFDHTNSSGDGGVGGVTGGASGIGSHKPGPLGSDGGRREGTDMGAS